MWAHVQYIYAASSWSLPPPPLSMTRSPSQPPSWSSLGRDTVQFVRRCARPTPPALARATLQGLAGWAVAWCCGTVLVGLVRLVTVHED